MKIADKLLILQSAGGDIRIILQRTVEGCDKWSIGCAGCGDRWWSWHMIGEGKWCRRFLGQAVNVDDSSQLSQDLTCRTGESIRERRQSFNPKDSRPQDLV